MMLDVRDKTWSSTILSSIGIDRKVLPRPIPSGQIIGKIKKQLCQSLNLSHEVIVITGGHDQPCGALGAGVAESGVAMYATGTVECISPVFDKFILSPILRESNLATYPYVVEDFYTTVAFNLTGGNILRWFRDEFGQEEIRLAEEQAQYPYDLILSQVPSQPTNLLVLPHFVATGTPHFDTSSKGAILGLGLETSRGQIIRALLEGVTYEMKYNIECLAQAGIEIRELRAIGGGAKSKIWMGIKADIMGLPIVSPCVTEAACLGAAMLAAIGCGQFASVAEAIKTWVVFDRVFDPDEKNVAKYQERYDIYKGLYQTLKPVSHKLAGLI